MKTGLVLSGGGVKGVFEAGAIECLVTEYGTKFDVIAGSSTGALIAGMALIEEYQMMNDIYRDSNFSDILDTRHIVQQFYTDGYYDSTPLRNLIHTYFDPYKASALWPAKKLFIKAINLRTGLRRIFTNEPGQEELLLQGLLASASIPVFMDPVMIEGDPYVDAGTRDNLPISDVLSVGVDRMFVIMVNPIGIQPLEVAPTGKIGIALRTLDIVLTEGLESDLKEGALLNHLAGTGSDVSNLPFLGWMPDREAETFYIYPEEDLSLGTLDFDKPRDHVWKKGYRRAHEVYHTFYGREFTA